MHGHPIQNVDRSMHCYRFWHLHVSQIDDINIYNEIRICLSTSQMRIWYEGACPLDDTA
jgi:hypothetical protein